ncbi:J domain-containing protein [Pseudomonas sp. NPDC089996]|uniref:J domain-containing protein n=1 Tax=Pseudomonas sp. NPDC089996 TaxID=3364474 RepID=UPI00382EF3B5
MNSVSDHWQVLELTPACDERTLKRQYAKLLKVTRPDEDPAAFQQLRDAYEQALQALRGERMDAQVAERASPSNSPPVSRTHHARSAHEQAVALLDGFDDVSIEQTWTEAQAKGIEGVLERLLFERCLRATSSHSHTLHWGIEQRQWLTPWQQFPASDAEQQHLSLILAVTLYSALEQLLAAGDHERFSGMLERASRQGWLADLERRQALQVHVLTLLLNDEDWPPELFEHLCQTFAWNAAGAAPPIADEHWQALRRCYQQRTWLSHLRSLADRREAQPSPDANAAALFLLAPQPEQQKALVAAFVEADWQACERLSEAFASRYPDLLGMFPNHDAWFWKTLVEPRDMPHGVKRAGAVITLALALKGLPSLDPVTTLILLPLYALGGLLAAKMGQWLFSHWAQIAASLQDIDQRVSAWCVSRHITRDRRELVIRNAGPLLGLAVLLWHWLGPLGLGTYVLIGIIGQLQPPTWGPQVREYRWRKPLQAVYRIAGLSGAQWLSCTVMVVVIGWVRWWPGITADY